MLFSSGIVPIRSIDQLKTILMKAIAADCTSGLLCLGVCSVQSSCMLLVFTRQPVFFFNCDPFFPWCVCTIGLLCVCFFVCLTRVREGSVSFAVRVYDNEVGLRLVVYRCDIP